MYLKRMEIAGFKSFADRTVIDFENQVTAIVGPNGSGKSNITEAIRWVLGEQSAKNLRGGKMPDVIFAGSDSRKPLNIAEVTIILDNADHYLPLDYSEISVTRRLRRTGESDFYLNKQACRLRDIQELFMDSGLGKESFSIISQGKVEAIFSSKPEDRRGIFEEAAGVLKYKQRKKQAEQKLFETADNLDRVQDIIYELADQLEPLTDQKKTAEQYLALKENLAEIDVSYTVAEMQEAKQIFAESSAAWEELEKVGAELTRQIAHKEKDIQNKRQRRSELDDMLESGNQDQIRVVEALKQAEGQREVLLERSKHTQKSSAEYQESLTAIEEKLADLDDEKSQLIAQLSKKNGAIQELEKKQEQTQAELAKYQKSAKELMEDLRSQYVDKLQEQAENRNERKNLERQYEQVMARNQHSLQKKVRLKAELNEKKAQLEKLQTQAVTLHAELAEQRQNYVQTTARTKKNQQEHQTSQQKMYRLMNERQQIQARIKSLQEIQENYSGFYQGVRAILQKRDQLSGIVGAVAEVIEVPADYTLAMETALGAAAQHLIVASEADARQAITYLKQQRAGRATFLPLTTIKSRQLSPTVRNQAQGIAGFIGVASDLVTFSETVRTVVENLLGTTLIAEDLDSANALARTVNYRYRVVSLEGDVMNAGGSMTGGATKRGNQGNLFSQSHELEALKEQSTRFDKRLQATEHQVQQFDQALKEGQKTLESLREAGEKMRLREQNIGNQVQNLQEAYERLQKEQKALDYETRDVDEFLENYEEQKNELEAKRQEIDRILAQTDQEIHDLDVKEDLLTEKRNDLTQALAELKAELAVDKEQATHLKQQIQICDQNQKEQTARKESLARQLQALSTDFSDHELNETSLKKQVADLGARKEQLQEALQAIRKERYEIQQKISQMDAELSQLHEVQKQKIGEKTHVEVEKNRAEILLDNRLQYLQEEYHLTFEAAQRKCGPVTKDPAVKVEIQNLRRKIEALGPVNLNAIEQFEQVNERYLFLSGQRDDLLSAKEQLFHTMSEMDEEVKTRFEETFTAIREEFKMVFPNMFGGGRAELILTDPHDLLNTGIEIEAQPPGKKLQSLSLLSGGERALTAIALLFSIIQVRPVPFCVLDEVEAALDEANVLRFGNYLQSFQNDTQFIVVTHRKGTMEAADVLYGVTMEESGVSKIVSVKLEEISDSGQINAQEAL